MMKRRVFRLMVAFIVFVMCFGLVSNAASFIDIQDHWASGAIEKWKEYKLVGGFPDNTFRPDDKMTRAEAATVMARLFGLEEKADISEFEDADANAWYYDAFAKCVKAGIINGDGSNLNANVPMTREMFFTMVARAFGITPEETLNAGFTDKDTISSWAKGYTHALINRGYVNGMTPTTVEPNGNITRASVVTVLNRLVEVYVVTDGQTVPSIANGYALICADDCKVENGFSGNVIVSKSNINISLKDASSDTKLLVLSDGVVITDSPSDIKIELGKDADDITVNGEKISGNTTYTVPEKEEERVTEEKTTIGSHSHKYVGNVAKKPTCSGEGVKTFTCDCGKSYTEAVPLDPNRHMRSTTVKENEKKGTCIETGHYDSVVYCSLCGEELERETKSSNFGAHVIEDGICRYCGESEDDTKAGIIIGSLEASPGENISVEVNIKNNPGILGAILRFTFNERLTLISAESGSAFAKLDMTKPGKFVSPCNFLWDGLDEAAKEDGEILTLNFEVADDAKAGDKLEISCSYGEGDLVGADFESLEIQITAGAVTIKQ